MNETSREEVLGTRTTAEARALAVTMQQEGDLEGAAFAIDRALALYPVSAGDLAARDREHLRARAVAYRRGEVLPLMPAAPASVREEPVSVPRESWAEWARLSLVAATDEFDQLRGELDAALVREAQVRAERLAAERQCEAADRRAERLGIAYGGLEEQATKLLGLAADEGSLDKVRVAIALAGLRAALAELGRVRDEHGRGLVA